MHILYNIGIAVYGVLIFIVGFFSSKAAKRSSGGRKALRYLKENIKPGERYIWFHAASLGEFEQGRPIIEELRRRYPSVRILLTFFSPSGYEVRKDYHGAELVCYLPLDTPRKARKFLDLVKPEKAVFIKYEFWANFLYELEGRKIPTYLASSIFRPKQIFFKSYGGFFHRLLEKFTLIFVQDENSKRLLDEIGRHDAIVSGDTRFDRVSDIAEAAKRLPIVESFACNAQVLVAGSTWAQDEELLIRYINGNHEKKLIIVPHEPTEENVERICKALRRSFVLYSKTNSTEVTLADCLIVDTVGLLSSIYRYGKVAYIGGGFGVGIHNTLEAAVWGIPVVFGPNYERFREARGLIACGGALSISSYRKLETEINQLFTDKESGVNAARYVKDNTGATDVVIGIAFADLQTDYLP